MWTITGEFDGDGVKDVAKTKLLKTNKTYTVGRKGTDVHLGSKKISGVHGEFIVGEFDASDPTSVPRLTYKNTKKPMVVVRLGKDERRYDANQEAVVKDGDEVQIIRGQGIIGIKVHWRKVCCYSETPTEYLEQCTDLGINLLLQPSPEVTHHLTATLDATPSLATSLISSAELVKPEWLEEILTSSLEDTFSLPLTSKYRPDPTPSLPDQYQQYKAWAPNEERLHIFQPYRFLCVAEKARQVPLDLRTMIERGDGTIESFDVHQPVAKFRKAIERGRNKEGKRLVVVGDETMLSLAVGKDSLKALVQEAQSFNLSFTPPKDLITAVLDVDTSKLDVELPEPSNDSPHVVEESIAETPVLEKSPSPPPVRARKRLTRRTVTVTPAPDDDPTILTKLQSDMVTGLDDPSFIIDAVPDLDAPAPAPAPKPTVPPTPLRTKLKRRAGLINAEPTPIEEGTFELVEDTFKEPPLKKFKALFEASDPDAIYAGRASQIDGDDDVFNDSPIDYSMPMRSGAPVSQTQTGTGTFSEDGPGLAPVPEEEEESAPTTIPRDLKRRLEDEDDVEMGDETRRPPAKRRTVESVHTRGASKPPSSSRRQTPAPPSTVSAPAPEELVPKPNSTSKVNITKPTGKKGAETGKPDKDTQFLKALASTKRGKKKEDEFDREFNKLKIAKPPLEDKPDPEEEWKILAEFGDDTDIRGNYMTILEMDVFKERSNGVGEGGRKELGTSNSAWAGKPNFKKFKSKNTRSERPKIDLIVVAGGNKDTTLDWDENEDQIRLGSMPTGNAKGKRASSVARSTVQMSDNDSGEEDIPPSKKPATAAASRSTARKPPSRASSRAGSAGPSSQAPKRMTATRKSQSQKASTIHEDDEDEDGGRSQALFLPDEDDDQSQRPKTQSRSRRKGASYDDHDEDDDHDDDDDMQSSYTMRTESSLGRNSLKSKNGSSSRSQMSNAVRGAGRRAAVKDYRDDSDDDVVFAGFGS